MSDPTGILLVDDQPDNLAALEAVLAPLGHRLVTASSGEEALKRLLDDDFAVIVMDVRMPGLDGFETVELIKQRKRHENSAVVFLTGADADSEQITRGYSAGAVDYILKPVDPDVLRSKVAMLLALHQKNAELRESEARFRAAFEGAPIGMGLSTIDGRWLEVNEAMCELLGSSRERLLSQPLWELAHPADRERERGATRRLLRDQPRLDQSEKRFMRPDGQVVHAIVNVSLSVDAQARPLNYIWQLVDVTEQRRAEAERAARAEAEAVAATVGKLQRITEAALEHLELRDLLDVLVERVREAFEAEVARILLLDPDEDELLAVGAARGVEPLEQEAAVPLEGTLDQVVRAGRPVTLNNVPAEALDKMMAAIEPRSLMAAPMTVKGRVAGVVDVARRRRFSAEDESLLVLSADRAALAIEHARAYERELGIVENLQRSLLPERLPQLPGLDIDARYFPGGADVGGDWYDAIPLDGGRLGVAMGDVVGHGIDAAALMGQLRYAARAYALDGHPPAAMLDKLDRLVRSLKGAHMATLLYLVLEADLSTVRFASAGHVPPLVVGPSGRAFFLEAAPNPPLGVFESEPHAELSAKLEPGSTLVLYTDGLVEQRGASIDAGLEALRQAARDPGHPTELCEHLVTTLLPEPGAQPDDVAVLALRHAPSTLHLDVSTDPTRLGTVRRDLAVWLQAVGAGRDDIECFQMACHEACSNAIEHGYGFGEGTFTIDAALEDGRLTVTVRDRGGWRERKDGPLPHRGHGLPLIEALMDDVELSRRSDGTTVRMIRVARPSRP
jgi:PAS domain S-box-containing protein